MILRLLLHTTMKTKIFTFLYVIAHAVEASLVHLASWTMAAAKKVNERRMKLAVSLVEATGEDIRRRESRKKS